MSKSKAARVPLPAATEADDLVAITALLKRYFPRATDAAVVVIPGDGLQCVVVTLLGDCPSSISPDATPAGTFARCAGCVCRY